MDVKLINKIKRQMELTEGEVEDFQGYDDIVAMKNEGIPNLKAKDYYSQFNDTTGRDVVQQAVNIYATQRPKWEVLPRGLGDIETAETFERVIEWYMWKAAQHGRKRFHSESLIHACKYNRICGQLEWLDEYSFCVKLYHPSSIKYEYGAKLQWVAVVNNVMAVSVIERWQEFREIDKDIDAALKKIEALVDEDSSQRVMYVDYTDEKKRYTYCYPVSDEIVDDELGIDDNGKEKDGLISIQDKDNALGFINWAIAEGEGDPLLAPLLKGGLYKNINDSETIKRTMTYKIAFFPNFLQQGSSNEDLDIDYSGDETIAKAPVNVQVTQLQQPPINPAFNELSAQDRGLMTASLGIGQTATLQASNVQHSTLQELLTVRLAQLEPYKRTAEQFMTQLAILMFRWSKKNNKILKAARMYSKGQDKPKGQEILVTPDDINLDALYIECQILPNNQNDQMQLVNQISMLKQSGIHIPDKEFVEKLNMGNPAVLDEEWQKQELFNAVLQAKLKELMAEVDVKTQAAIMQIQAGIQMQQQQQQLEQQMAMAQQQPQGGPAGQAPAQQGQPLPSDQMTSGQGFNAAAGGTPPQTANPSITQAGR